MDPRYAIEDTRDIFSPALVVFRDLVEHNIRHMIEIAGSAARLRPHCKTHKMRAVTELELSFGITKHKCATFAEAEMLALAGATDIMLAYNPVGPNIRRTVQFIEKFPHVAFMVTADHGGPITELGRAVSDAGKTIGVILDIDTGHHRTGLPIGEAAQELYGLIARTRGLVPAGLHIYDGQNQQTPLEERTAAVEAIWNDAIEFRDDLEERGWPVPRLVAGGTGSFPIFARQEDRALELSPGTIVFHDAGYRRMFPDLDFIPAALLLTRVVSRPSANRVTLDVGNKAVASDPPMGTRLFFPDLPDAKQVLHNEEHLVLETPHANDYQPGDELLAIPRHICPTSALHKQAWVVHNGRVETRWDVTARDRWITV